MAAPSEYHVSRRKLALDTTIHTSVFSSDDETEHSSHDDHRDHCTTNGRALAVAGNDQARATPAMDIPHALDHTKAGGSRNSDEGDSYMDRYMRQRNPSISFSNEVRTDSGHRQTLGDPLEKPARTRGSGRSMMAALAVAQQKQRANSDSVRDHFDPVTGRQLPPFSTSPPRDEPHVGEARFPLLQHTVDELAAESDTRLPQTRPLSMPGGGEMVETPLEEQGPSPSWPIHISSSSRNIATSPEYSRPFRRTVSERWRSGEPPPDLFTLAKGSRRATGSWRSIRRDTNSAKSPSSVASSFLRGFSVGSGGDDSTTSASIDAEGQTIGEDYVLGKQIGFGGFSIVREVTQLSSETGRQRKLAVKIVRRNLDGKSENENEAAQAEFEHEVELWRFLSHPHILPLEAVYKLDEATFCFIPLNTGGTLFDLMRKNRGGLSTDLTRHYTYQIASALRYLHLDARVIHRDVKLENCLLDLSQGEPGIVRLCDFGMAEWVSNDSRSSSRHADLDSPPHPRKHDTDIDHLPPKLIGPADSSTAAFAGGSLEYAAPEIIRRARARPSQNEDGDDNRIERSIVSPAVDIWALGVCLYTFITGRRPFSDSFQPRVVMSILAGDWDRDSVREKLSGLGELESKSAPILDVLSGCLKMNERKRWRINDVMQSTWFDEERTPDETGEDSSSRGWRL